MQKGFTLIELLVVVLIIGILSAIAFPQYQKAIWRSKNAQLKQMVSAIWKAEQVYYMANGQYTQNFDELDVNLPLPTRTVTSSNLCYLQNTSRAGAVKLGKDFGVGLGSSGAIGEIYTLSVWGVWTEGPYECKGFTARSTTSGRLVCSGVGTKEEVAKFCEKVEAATFDTSANAQTHYFSLP